MEKDKNPSAPRAKNKEINLDKYYKAPDSLSVRSLNFGLWFATKRKPQVMSNKNLIADLLISAPQIFDNHGSYDLTLKMKNPNDKFMAHFDYCFWQAGEEKICQAGFIFPGEDKYLLALGQKLSSTADVSFRLKNLSWQRINTHIYPDWANFYKTHTDFVATNIKFNETEGLGGDLNNLEFTLSNYTPYNFWAVPFDILIFNGNDLISVNTYTAKEFLSQEAKTIKLNWGNRLGNSKSITIVPNLDIVASDIYIKTR
ncbi:MAG: hypothetical protein NTX66_04455 [Candidatus Falkowbacteria bacterium]|nr:hypothetical protein [Candidatus Falkowbacteria bacterium]